ncbi:MAG: M20 family metallo-hydrolase [Promethearchaeota archaeon]
MEVVHTGGVNVELEFPRARVEEWIRENRSEILEVFEGILRVPAVSPQSGGTGEFDKAQYLLGLFKRWGWTGEVHEIDAPDPAAKNRVRPNLVLEHGPGAPPPCLTIVTHLDVVPPGNLDDWDTPPFEPTIRDGKLHARGAEDNGQGIVASIFALKCIRDLQLPLAHPVKLVFVADEETGSKFGIRFLLETHDLFKPADLVLVPDAGDPSGLKIEVAEKGILWVDVTVTGKSAHGSRPGDGLNAHRVGNILATRLDATLHERFSGTNELFDPPTSTFEPTRRSNPVQNRNTIPGVDHQSWDCRLLPQHSIDRVMGVFKQEAQKLAAETGAQVSIEFPQVQRASPPVDEDDPALERLGRALLSVRGEGVELVGIGGGTCAAFFRERGIPALVWGRIDEVAHQPNEYCNLEYLFEDIMVYCAFLGEFEATTP